MSNSEIGRIKMRELEPNERIKNFNEVACGYTEEDALIEASRCFNCKTKPCTKGCPVSVDIPEFIDLIRKHDYDGAYQKIKETNSLPAVCGRVCPQEKQCESKCIRGIKSEPVAIGWLERFCTDYHINHKAEEKKHIIEKNGYRIAIIGSGPSSLSCAGELARLGYAVTVFEAFHVAGGVLVYGIPEFRLPKAVVENEINELKELGVDIKTNMVVGKAFTVDELFDDGYNAVFVGTGAGLPQFMGIPGEASCGVFSANEYLTRVNLMKAYRNDYETPVFRSRKVAVVGGGNVAMDAARCAKRLGADEVHIIYRRSEEEMPARKDEIDHAKEEGIVFDLLMSPCKILSNEDGFVTGMLCEKMKLGEPDERGRRKPISTGEIAEFDFDMVIIAVGTSPNPLIRMTTPGLETNASGCIITSDGVTTTRKGVFAGGDAVTGAATVILAMGAGKNAAVAIDAYCKKKN